MAEIPDTNLPRILFVDDDVPLRRLMEVALGKICAIQMAADGETGIAAFRRQTPDLVILDVNMPRMDGWQMLAQIRAESDVPVIMLTAQDRAADVERGFRLGADDFMTKPFAFQDLRARIEAILQRTSTAESPDDASAAPPRAGIRLDDESGRAWVGRRPVDLTPIEYRILRCLVEKRPNPVMKEALFREAWGYSQETYSHLVDIAIERMRKKIERDPENPEILRSSWDGGYYLDD